MDKEKLIEWLVEKIICIEENMVFYYQNGYHEVLKREQGKRDALKEVLEYVEGEK